MKLLQLPVRENECVLACEHFVCVFAFFTFGVYQWAHISGQVLRRTKSSTLFWMCHEPWVEITALAMSLLVTDWDCARFATTQEMNTWILLCFFVNNTTCWCVRVIPVWGHHCIMLHFVSSVLSCNIHCTCVDALHVISYMTRRYRELTDFVTTQSIY